MRVRARALFLCISLLGLGLAAAPGCTPRVVPVTRSVTAEGPVRVDIKEIKDTTFIFLVSNFSDEPLVVDRDAIFVITPRGGRGRVQRGATTTYSIPPGGTQEVRAQFGLWDVKAGEELQVHFSSALLKSGKAIAIEPLRFKAPL